VITTDKGYFPGNKISLWYNPNETFSPVLGSGTRLRLILVENGTGILHLGEHQESFIAPALFCLNEMDHPEAEQCLDLRAQALYFHPRAINSALTFVNVRGESQDLSSTDIQDAYWLGPFVKRDSEYNGHLHIGPVSSQRMALLFGAMNQALTEQNEWCWTCRARSLLLEMLFLLERIFTAPEALEENILPEPESVHNIDTVILYLHTHYQEKITIAKLAKIFHTNRTTLAEQFRETTGVPIITYLIQLRIRLAAAMLRDTALSVSEIRKRVGFKDDSHFGRMFRKHINHSPTQYRQLHCWVEQQWWLPRQTVSEPWRSIRKPPPSSQ